MALGLEDMSHTQVDEGRRQWLLGRGGLLLFGLFGLLLLLLDFFGSRFAAHGWLDFFFNSSNLFRDFALDRGLLLFLCYRRASCCCSRPGSRRCRRELLFLLLAFFFCFWVDGWDLADDTDRVD